MQIRVHVEADSKIDHATSPRLGRLVARSHGLPVAVAAKSSFVSLVKGVAVFIHRASRYRWIAKVAVPIRIGPPAFRHIVPACFKSIVKAALSKSLTIRRGVRRRVVCPLVLCTAGQYKRKCQVEQLRVLCA